MVMIMVPQEYLHNSAVPNVNNGPLNNYNTPFMKSSQQRYDMNDLNNRGSLESLDSIPKPLCNNSNQFQESNIKNSDMNHVTPFNSKSLRSPNKRVTTPKKKCKSLVCSI
jgi:hypothetical protein